MKQAFNRRETNKEKVFKEAMAFLISYSSTRKHSKPLEVKYNIARALHYLGMNTHAQKFYEEVLESAADTDSMGGSVEKEELSQRARYNLSQLLKGSGISLGITVRGANEASSAMKMGT